MKKLIISLFILISFSIANAQDPEFTQYYAAPIYTNPAMVGNSFCDNSNGGRASINYRNQWPQLPGNFVTTAFSIDQHINEINGGLGMMIVSDVAGVGNLTTTSASLIYAYVAPVNYKQTIFIRAGIEGIFSQRSINFDRFLWGDMIDPVRGFIYRTDERIATETINYANFATGTVVYSKRFYAGLAVHNLVEPRPSFYESDNANSRIPRRYTFHSGITIPIDKLGENIFSPNILYMNQLYFTQLNLGFYLNNQSLVSGLWFRQSFGTFRTSDAVMLLVGFKKDKFRFSYSYDITISDARSSIRSSHEISSTIDWCLPGGRKTSIKPIPCPVF